MLDSLPPAASAQEIAALTRRLQSLAVLRPCDLRWILRPDVADLMVWRDEDPNGCDDPLSLAILEHVA